jgi:hypothetical protein
MRLRTTLALVTTGLWLGIGSPVVAHAGPQPAGAGASAEPDAASKAQAKKLFDQGKVDFAAKRYTEALAAFQESYRLVKSPNSHLWIVYSKTELGRVAEAYDEAELLVAEAEQAAAENPKYAPTAQAAKDEQKRVRGKIALVTVQVDTAEGGGGELSLTVGGQSIAAERWGTPLPMPPGPVEVVISGPNGSATEKAELEAGGESTITIKPPAAPVVAPPVGPVEPVEEDSGGKVDLLIPAVIAGGVGIAGLACFGIFGAMSMSEYSDLETECAGNSCPPSRSSDGDDGRTYQTVANITLVVGIVGVAAGATLLIIDLTQGDDEASAEEPTEPAPAEVEASVAFGPGSVMVQGTF